MLWSLLLCLDVFVLKKIASRPPSSVPKMVERDICVGRGLSCSGNEHCAMSCQAVWARVSPHGRSAGVDRSHSSGGWGWCY
jgi:hypothetical protein